MRKKVFKCVCVFAAFFTGFFHVSYKLFQGEVVFLLLCIIPAVLDCEKSSVCDKINFLLLVILFISWQYPSSFCLSREYFDYSMSMLALLD